MTDHITAEQAAELLVTWGNGLYSQHGYAPALARALIAMTAERDAKDARIAELERMNDSLLSDAAQADAYALSAWQCIYTDGKTGLVNDEYGHQFCQMERRADAAFALGLETAAAKTDKIAQRHWQAGVDMSANNEKHARQLADYTSRCIDDVADAIRALSPLTPLQAAMQVAEVLAMRAALVDAISGLAYIRENYGDPRGVGFDRVFDAGIAALAPFQDASE